MIAEMSIDLTRFDFNAKRFVHSDTVRSMSLEEIGQFILLLSEAWLTGKDASLPDDAAALANMCRGRKVSPKVLLQFPLVPGTDRRRNEPLYKEWLAATKRSEGGRKSAEARWGGNATAMRTHSDGTADELHTHMPKPYQSNPNQTKQKEKAFAEAQVSEQLRLEAEAEIARLREEDEFAKENAYKI
jgi:uncharacterized protein YdaU (DUF1376 family)